MCLSLWACLCPGIWFSKTQVPVSCLLWGIPSSDLTRSWAAVFMPPSILIVSWADLLHLCLWRKLGAFASSPKKVCPQYVTTLGTLLMIGEVIFNSCIPDRRAFCHLVSLDFFPLSEEIKSPLFLLWEPHPDVSWYPRVRSCSLYPRLTKCKSKTFNSSANDSLEHFKQCSAGLESHVVTATTTEKGLYRSVDSCSERGRDWRTVTMSRRPKFLLPVLAHPASGDLPPISLCMTFPWWSTTQA